MAVMRPGPRFAMRSGAARAVQPATARLSRRGPGPRRRWGHITPTSPESHTTAVSHASRGHRGACLGPDVLERVETTVLNFLDPTRYV